ncbi:DUF4376 domain-containing protein [Photobacterium sp. GSS17]|uniref:DUF4376 domain-containing protein n=1 Tax=Photobacterium sp. GSS17 TaxID=3020715 RepID=UPI002362AFB3|nr:hypothetical protein [Photobacterium sp. GSS17]
MFAKIEDVPEPLKGFYQVVTTREPTGNMVEAPFEYEDENGVLQTGTRLEPEFMVVAEVKALPRHDLKTWEDLLRINRLHGQSKGDFLQYVFNKAEEADGWTFHDTYLAWYERYDALFNTYPERVPGTEDEWVDGLSPDVKTQRLQELRDQEPVRQVNPEKDRVLLAMAKESRQQIVESDIEVNGHLWQVRPQDRDNMKAMIDAGERNGMTDDSVAWILENNDLHETTIAELKAVLDAYAFRMNNVFMQYAAWREGDRSNMFIYVENAKANAL